MDFRRLPEMLRAAPWRTPPELAVQAALGPSMEVAVLLRDRCVGVPASFCTVIGPLCKPVTCEGNPYGGSAQALCMGQLQHSHMQGPAGHTLLVS